MQTWRKISHPCIVSFLGSYVIDGQPALCLEYMSGGTLHELIHGGRGYAPDQSATLRARIIAEVSRGLAHLHSSGVMHRDVKSTNVLLDGQGHAKLSDFGVASSASAGGDDAEHTAETGTYRNMAPEVIMHKPYSHKCDVYSFGVLLWETLHRAVPFAHLSPVQVAFAVAVREARPTIALSPGLRVYSPLIVSCWDAEPSRRPDMEHVVEVATELLRGLRDSFASFAAA